MTRLIKSRYYARTKQGFDAVAKKKVLKLLMDKRVRIVAIDEEKSLCGNMGLLYGFKHKVRLPCNRLMPFIFSFFKQSPEPLLLVSNGGNDFVLYSKSENAMFAAQLTTVTDETESWFYGKFTLYGLYQLFAVKLMSTSIYGFFINESKRHLHEAEGFIIP